MDVCGKPSICCCNYLSVYVFWNIMCEVHRECQAILIANIFVTARLVVLVLGIEMTMGFTYKILCAYNFQWIIQNI